MKVTATEICDVVIPDGMKRDMARQAENRTRATLQDHRR